MSNCTGSSLHIKWCYLNTTICWALAGTQLVLSVNGLYLVEEVFLKFTRENLCHWFALGGKFCFPKQLEISKAGMIGFWRTSVCSPIVLPTTMLSPACCRPGCTWY